MQNMGNAANPMMNMMKVMQLFNNPSAGNPFAQNSAPGNPAAAPANGTMVGQNGAGRAPQFNLPGASLPGINQGGGVPIAPTNVPMLGADAAYGGSNPPNHMLGASGGAPMLGAGNSGGGALDVPFQSQGPGFGSVINGAGQIGSGIASYFQDNPYDASNEYLDRIGREAGSHLSPYEQAGKRALPTLEEQFSKLVDDPQALLDWLSGGYEESPGYQYSVDEATKAANQAAAAGGMVGSPASQFSLARDVQGLASRDFSDYLNRALGLFGTGLQGFGDLAHMGQQSATNMAQLIAQQLAAQAQNAASGAQWNNQRGANGISDIISGAGQIAGF